MRKEIGEEDVKRCIHFLIDNGYSGVDIFNVGINMAFTFLLNAGVPDEVIEHIASYMKELCHELLKKEKNKNE